MSCPWSGAGQSALSTLLRFFHPNDWEIGRKKQKFVNVRCLYFLSTLFLKNLVVVIVSDVIGVKRQMVTEELSALCHQSSVINIYFFLSCNFFCQGARGGGFAEVSLLTRLFCLFL